MLASYLRGWRLESCLRPPCVEFVRSPLAFGGFLRVLRSEDVHRRLIGAAKLSVACEKVCAGLCSVTGWHPVQGVPPALCPEPPGIDSRLPDDPV